MGSYRRYQGALLIAALLLIVGSGAEAASRQSVPINPGAAARGSGTPTSSGGTLSIPGPMQGEYIPRTGSGTKGVPLNVQPRIDFSIPRTFNQLKRGLGFSWPGLAASAAVGLALDAVDTILTPEGPMVPTYTDQPGLVFWRTTEQNVIVNGPSVRAVCEEWTALRGYHLHSVTVPGSLGPNVIGGCHWDTSSPPQKRFTTPVHYVSGVCPVGTGYNPETGGCRAADGLRPATDSDLAPMQDFINAQDAAWIRDLLRDVCEASPSPDRCFDEMMEQSALSGPSTVPGGSETTTSTTIGPDGTPQTTTTTTTTEYNIRYGDSYFDYSQRKTSIVNHPDGSTTETTTEETDDVVDQDQESGDFADTAFPEVPSFYEAKYPDGLQGVWNDARSRLDQSDFLSFLRSFVPSFSGTCPSWSVGFNIASWANYGTQSFSSLCHVFDFVKIVLLVTAAFMSRRIIFGG